MKRTKNIEELVEKDEGWQLGEGIKVEEASWSFGGEEEKEEKEKVIRVVVKDKKSWWKYLVIGLTCLGIGYTAGNCQETLVKEVKAYFKASQKNYSQKEVK